MITPAERFKGWIDSLANAWKDRLRGWMASWVMKGVETTFDFFEPDLRAEIKPSLQRLRDIPELPDDLKAILDKAIAEPSAIQFAALLPYLIAVMIGFAMGSMQPAMRMGGYALDLIMHSYRFDPASVITAWRRDPIAYEKFFEDLRSQGWTDERIEAFKFITLFIPTADEQTHWLAREVYEPEMVDRYGLDSELPNYEETDFSKIGVTPEQMKNKWAAHWEHASYMQIREMLRRGVLSLDKTMPAPPTTEAGWDARDAEGSKAMYDWYRLVEIPPFWRDRLTEMAFEVPTRVDVRRFWDMRTIDEERLRSIYHSQGYHGKDLDDYILWTKVYVAFPDLVARYKNGWITEDDVRSELTGLGMPGDRVDEMLQTKIKTAQPERVATERNLTKADIYKAIKKERISSAQGMELLQGLGFDAFEAELLIAINVPVEETITETKARELTKTDIKAGLKTKLITETEAYSRLLELRYIPTDVDLLMKIFAAVAEPSEEVKDREASKADIVKAVKDGLIEPEEGYLMLQDIGFTPEASQFILAVRAEVSPFSPASYGELYKQIERYRKAGGLPVDIMPEEIVEAEKVYKQAEATLRHAESQKKEGEELAPYLKALSDAKYRYRTLLVSWEEEKKKLP